MSFARIPLWQAILVLFSSVFSASLTSASSDAKVRIVLAGLLLSLGSLAAHESLARSRLIVSGNTGEVYFVGLHPNYPGECAFYYSNNYGATIELRDFTNPDSFCYGRLIEDYRDGTFYRFGNLSSGIEGQLLTQNGGFSWDLMNSSYTLSDCYASGRAPGVVFRRGNGAVHPLLERSSDYGRNYISFHPQGIEDGLIIEDLALGAVPGEVFTLTHTSALYYSNDDGHTFSYLNNLYQAWGIYSSSAILNGAEDGELYIYFDEFSSSPKYIWRCSDFGMEIELVGYFPLGNYWHCSAATTRVPGEIYFLALEPNWTTGTGGVIRIYHTVDGGRDWSYYEHFINASGIQEGDAVNGLSTTLQIYPNPTNSSFNLNYQLTVQQDVLISLCNSLGAKLWEMKLNQQPQGHLQLNLPTNLLPSGAYYLQLQTAAAKLSKPVIIIK